MMRRLFMTAACGALSVGSATGSSRLFDLGYKGGGLMMATVAFGFIVGFIVIGCVLIDDLVK